jgi:translation initiation factor 3 subunit B
LHCCALFSSYAICEYSKKEEAKAAIARLNEYKLDKKHTFIVNAYSDLQKYEAVPDEYLAPTVEPLADKVSKYLHNSN